MGLQKPSKRDWQSSYTRKSFHDELPPVLPGRSIASKEHTNSSLNLNTSTKHNNNNHMVVKKAGAGPPPPLNLVSMKGTSNNNKLQPRTTRTATLRKLKLRNSVMNMPSPMTSVPMMAKRAQSTSNLLIDQNNTTKYKQKK